MHIASTIPGVKFSPPVRLAYYFYRTIHRIWRTWFVPLFGSVLGHLGGCTLISGAS